MVEDLENITKEQYQSTPFIMRAAFMSRLTDTIDRIDHSTEEYRPLPFLYLRFLDWEEVMHFQVCWSNLSKPVNQGGIPFCTCKGNK